MPNIAGRALLQASPAHAYNAEAIVAHALAYDREFAAAGISKDRYCIKILTTGPGMLAANILESQHGISTLGTGLFSVPQALAAAQVDASTSRPTLTRSSPTSPHPPRGWFTTTLPLSTP